MVCGILGEKADNLVRHTATIGAEVLIHNMAREKGEKVKTPKRLPKVDI